MASLTLCPHSCCRCLVACGCRVASSHSCSNKLKYIRVCLSCNAKATHPICGLRYYRVLPTLTPQCRQRDLPWRTWARSSRLDVCIAAVGKLRTRWCLTLVTEVTIFGGVMTTPAWTNGTQYIGWDCVTSSDYRVRISWGAAVRDMHQVT